MQWKKKNDGKWLERLLAVTHRAYLDQGIAKIEKVEPPTVMVGGGLKKQTRHLVQLRNPFVDFIGSTRGRTVCMEAKSTEEPTLRLLADNGVKPRQWDALIEWEKNGAMCGVCWGYNNEVRFLSMATMRERLASGKKVMQWDEAEKVAQGIGFVLNDWLLNMRDGYNYPLTDPLMVRAK